jgi:hypothetical protein
VPLAEQTVQVLCRAVLQRVCAWLCACSVVYRDRGLRLNVHTREGSPFKPSHLRKVSHQALLLLLHIFLSLQPAEGAAAETEKCGLDGDPVSVVQDVVGCYHLATRTAVADFLCC